MCGITGWVSYEGDITCRRDIVDAMTETMSCRGPDASGAWVRHDVALGHRRLAVIDLPGGAQPMHVEIPRGQIVLVYSGEIYNYLELRDDLLARGHCFRTESDTEVVLRGYVEWGEQVAEYLNGMFAFAVWDECYKKIVMIRDRMGIKPLYYYPTNDGVVFGSESKAIFANPLASKIVDAAGLRQLVMSSADVWGQSIWKNVYEVQPGTVVVVDEKGIRTRTYWKLPTREHTDDLDTTVATVRELLADIVGRQLVADVPQCALLSGGLDSSSISALAATHLADNDKRLQTFSIDYAGHAENFSPSPSALLLTRDAPYAQEVAKQIKSEHHNVVLDSEKLIDPAVRRAVISARDAPGFGEMDASLYLLFKEVGRSSTVALSGESADELFGGYPAFYDSEMRTTLTNSTHVARGAVSDLAKWLNEDLVGKLEIFNHVADLHSSAVSDVEHVDGVSAVEREVRIVGRLMITGFLRALLARKDRVSMALGLEVRVPYCDHRLVEYVYNIPWKMKFIDGIEKSLLRRAMQDLLPVSVAQRKKSGFPSSNNPQFTEILRNQVNEAIANRDNQAFSIIDKSWIEELMKMDSSSVGPSYIQAKLNRVLDFVDWFDMYNPKIELD